VVARNYLPQFSFGAAAPGIDYSTTLDTDGVRYIDQWRLQLMHGSTWAFVPLACPV
jgi:hypothetical protein